MSEDAADETADGTTDVKVDEEADEELVLCGFTGQIVTAAVAKDRQEQLDDLDDYGYAASL